MLPAYLFYAVYIIVLAITPIIVRTYKTKNHFRLWLYILLPPFLIVPFALVPIRDPMILMEWLAIFPFLLGSVIFLFIRIYSILFKPHDKLIKIKLIRPIITILIFVFVFKYHKTSKHMANLYAIELAQKIQVVCDVNGLCPEAFANWENERGFRDEPNYFSTSIDKLAIPYYISYHPSKDRKSFSLYLSHGFNMGINFEGGIDKKLKATYSDEGGECDFPIK
ncbi:MAG: hypothetical protein NTW93_00830 [Phycisphaerae bacterium]|nr:hypothetical protein [Phycisphaerae bacterium]